MVSKKVKLGFNPEECESQEDLKLLSILEVIREHGCSYPSEICGETDISKETVYRKLRFAEKQGVLKKLSLEGVDHVPDWLAPRIKDLWSRGIKGDAIRRLSWYMVVDDGKKKN